MLELQLAEGHGVIQRHLRALGGLRGAGADLGSQIGFEIGRAHLLRPNGGCQGCNNEPVNP